MLTVLQTHSCFVRILRFSSLFWIEPNDPLIWRKIRKRIIRPLRTQKKHCFFKHFPRLPAALFGCNQKKRRREENVAHGPKTYSRKSEKFRDKVIRISEWRDDICKNSRQKAHLLLKTLFFLFEIPSLNFPPNFWTSFRWNFAVGGAQKECASDRSRRELSYDYLVAKIGVDTPENDPLKVLFILRALIFTEPPFRVAQRQQVPSRIFCKLRLINFSRVKTGREGEFLRNLEF